jgi:hypothetical protein
MPIPAPAARLWILRTCYVAAGSPTQIPAPSPAPKHRPSPALFPNTTAPLGQARPSTSPPPSPSPVCACPLPDPLRTSSSISEGRRLVRRQPTPRHPASIPCLRQKRFHPRIKPPLNNMTASAFTLKAPTSRDTSPRRDPPVHRGRLRSRRHRGTTSCPDAGPAASPKKPPPAQRPLSEAGIGHASPPMTTCPRARSKTPAPPTCPTTPNLPAAHLKALTRFLAAAASSGLLLASPNLGHRMGSRSPLHQGRPPRPLALHRVRRPRRLARPPPRIWQNSTSLMPAQPPAPARVSSPLGKCAQRCGQPEPALVVSPRGFWRSHILLCDDTPRKRNARFPLRPSRPLLWDPAAAAPSAMPAASTLPERRPRRLTELTKRQHAVAARPAEILAMLDESLLLSSRIRDALSAARPQEPLLYARRQRQSFARRAAVQIPRPGDSSPSGTHRRHRYISALAVTTAPISRPASIHRPFRQCRLGRCAPLSPKYLPPSTPCPLRRP